jgi:membrane protein DedA with SNARE-associated domain
METLGGPGAGLLVALESVFPPIPSELILPLAGFTASLGELSLVSAIIWCTIGSLVGALTLYSVGAALGRDRVKHLVARLPLVDQRDVDLGERWFVRHGYAAVFFGRMLPIVRSAISIPAGVERMPLLRFAAYTAAGSGIWNTIFIVAGFQLGERYHLVERYAEVLQYTVIAVGAGLVGWFVVVRLRRRA